MRIAILFDNFGPYHLARLKAASAVCELLAIEFGSSSMEYAWDASSDVELKREVLNKDGESARLSRRDFKHRLERALNAFEPEAVFVPGWSCRGALLGLSWCLKQGVPAIVMSESTAWDDQRHPVKEWIKSSIISFFSAALVGGSPHRAYLEQLRMPPDRIFLGYDVVDNGFFSEEVRKIVEGRASRVESDAGKKKPYFLASARFIKKKNLPMLLRAYALYRQEAITAVEVRGLLGNGHKQHQSNNNDQPFPPWDFVLLGDGPMRPELCLLISLLGLEGCVHMPGFKQYDALPSYYAGASAFIHASKTEQWGLVVNEAMASGLPVLVSNRCGCATDLVREGFNGWTFDPGDQKQLADLMCQLSGDEMSGVKMGEGSREIIAEWGPDRFVSGFLSAIKSVNRFSKRRYGLFQRLILWAMTCR